MNFCEEFETRNNGILNRTLQRNKDRQLRMDIGDEKQYKLFRKEQLNKKPSGTFRSFQNTIQQSQQ